MYPPEYSIELSVQTADAHLAEVPVRVDDLLPLRLSLHMMSVSLVTGSPPSILTLLFPVRFMLLPSAFSQVIGVLASSSPHVTCRVIMVMFNYLVMNITSDMFPLDTLQLSSDLTLWGLTFSPAWRALRLVASQSWEKIMQ